MCGEKHVSHIILCSYISWATHSYVAELTEQIQVKSAGADNAANEEGEESEFVRYFPSFVWAVRDFTLERKIEGQAVSEDEYLEFALQIKKG